MKNMIRQAFDPIKADQDLIDRTRLSVESALGRPPAGSRHNRRLMRIITAAAALILTAGILAFAGVTWIQTPVAALSIEINPSIELAINALNRVVTARSFNEDGAALLAGLDLRQVPVKEAVAGLVMAAARSGYLAADGSSIIAITSSTDDENLKNQLELISDDAAREALAQTGCQASIYHDNTAHARIEEAHQLGITPGRLNLIQKLIDLDPTKKVGNYLTANAADIMKAVNDLQQQQREAEKNAEKEIRESEKEAGQTTQESEKETKQSGQKGQNGKGNGRGNG